MSYTEKRLEEFDERFNKPLRSDINKFINREGDIHTYLDLSDIKSFLATSIHQAIEEERERVKKVIDEPLNFDSRTSATLRDEIVKIINHERQRILSSLDKPLTEKEIEEMPQMKGTLEALNNLTIIK